MISVANSHVGHMQGFDSAKGVARPLGPLVNSHSSSLAFSCNWVFVFQ